MVRTDFHVITKFSRMGRLLHFLFHGAPLARFARKSSAKSPERQQNKYDLKTQLLTYCSLLSALGKRNSAPKLWLSRSFKTIFLCGYCSSHWFKACFVKVTSTCKFLPSYTPGTTFGSVKQMNWPWHYMDILNMSNRSTEYTCTKPLISPYLKNGLCCIHTDIYLQFSSQGNPLWKILIANHSSEMGFSHVRKAFRPIRRDLSKHNTGFMQQVQVLCEQTSMARKPCVPKVQKHLYI